MCENLKENLAFLQLLAQTKSDSQRYALLETATPSQVRALSEISLHVVKLIDLIENYYVRT